MKLFLSSVGCFLVGLFLIILLLLMVLGAIFTGINSSRGNNGNGNGQIVSNALAMAAHLHNGGMDNFDVVMDSGFPQPAISFWDSVCGSGCGWAQNGNLQCGVFVGMAYGWAGLPLVGVNAVIQWWGAYANGNHPGWIEIANGAGMPQLGDIIIMDSPYFGGVGHSAIVVGIKLPVNGGNGSLTFAEANGPTPLVTMPLAPNGALLVTWANYTVKGFIRHPMPLPPARGVRVTRLSQLDQGQYASYSEWQTWAYSACSTASMTEVMDAYGRSYRITDVLKVEAARGDITPSLGLTYAGGIADTVGAFGFSDHAYTPGQLTLSQLIAIANSGYPVIVDWPPDRYAGGHLLVVVGGDTTTIQLVDSSAYDYTAMSLARFSALWGGHADVVYPSH
jgi:hypothetical protein